MSNAANQAEDQAVTSFIINGKLLNPPDHETVVRIYWDERRLEIAPPSAPFDAPFAARVARR